MTEQVSQVGAYIEIDEESIAISQIGAYIEFIKEDIVSLSTLLLLSSSKDIVISTIITGRKYGPALQ